MSRKSISVCVAIGATASAVFLGTDAIISIAAVFGACFALHVHWLSEKLS
jgi:hypothetical protein